MNDAAERASAIYAKRRVFALVLRLRIHSLDGLPAPHLSLAEHPPCLALQRVAWRMLL